MSRASVTEPSMRSIRRIELSPSPEPPRLTATAGPSRLTTAVSHHANRSVMSVDDVATHEGDVYVINAMNGDRFHLSVALQGPYHPLTTVTHDALYRTVRRILLPPSPGVSGGEGGGEPLTLLLDGMPLSASTAAVLPNNAVVVVHCGASVHAPQGDLAVATPQQPRTLSSLRGAAGDGVAVVGSARSDSQPPSAAVLSEREVSIVSDARPGGTRHRSPPHSGGPGNAPALASPAAAAARSGSGGGAPSSASSAAPSQRLPPRRGNTRHPVGSSLGGDAEGGVSERQAAVSFEAAAAPASTFSRTSAERRPHPVASATSHANAADAEVTTSESVRSRTDAASLRSPPPAHTRTRSLASSPTAPGDGERDEGEKKQKETEGAEEEDGEYVVRTPSAPVPATPPDALQDTGISATTVSAPSSIAAMPSLRSMNDTHIHVDGAAAAPAPTVIFARDVLSGDRTPQSVKGTASVTANKKSVPSSVSAASSASPNWDRRGPIPVSIIQTSSLLLQQQQPANGTPSRPSTAFASPASAELRPTFVDGDVDTTAMSPSPPTQQPRAKLEPPLPQPPPPPPREPQLIQVQLPFGSKRPAEQTTQRQPQPVPDSSKPHVPATPLSAASSVAAQLPSRSAPTPATAVSSSSPLFQTPARQTQGPAQPERDARRPDRANASVTFATTTITGDGHGGGGDNGNTSVASVPAPSLLPVSPLPPYAFAAAAAETQVSRRTERVEARQTAYDAQRAAIVTAAAAEQQRLLDRLREHCSALEAEKKALLAERLSALRAQDAASRLRVLRAAQEDAAADAMDAVRARLGQHRDELYDYWLRVVHAHGDAHYPLSPSVLRQLEEEGEQLTLQCLSAVANYHTQKARLQSLQQQRVLRAAEVARLRWEAHVRRCTEEETRGCLRVVARVRPPLRRPWLPDWVLASPEAQDFDRGYAVRVTAKAAADGGEAPQPVVEVLDPVRHLRRRYSLAGCYGGEEGNDAAAQQQRLFKEQLQPLLEHMCRTGQRVAVLAFGAVGSGKTYTLVGPHVEPPPPAPGKKKEANAGTPQAPSRSRDSASSSASDTDDDDDDEEEDEESEAGQPRSDERLGVSGAPSSAEAAGRGRVGVTRCLDPAAVAEESRLLHTLAAADEQRRRRSSAERREREERRWRQRAGVGAEDGLLPRAVAWLTAHLRSNAAESAVEGRHGGGGGAPVVESILFSMYEVYCDHIYDLLPASPPPPSAVEDLLPNGKPRSDPATWPRWNAGWLPAPHVKHSNPEKLTELQLELVPADESARDGGAATVSQQQQPAAQPQWRVKASEVEVRSPTEVLEMVRVGLQRRRVAQTQRSAQSSRSHLFLRFRVEVLRPAMPARASQAAARAAATTAETAEMGNGALEEQDRPKGYSFLCDALTLSTTGGGAADTTTGAAAAASPPALPGPTCMTELLFTDFAGSERVDLGGVSGDALREAQYINASLSAVADVLTALAQANPAQQPAGPTATAAREAKVKGDAAAPQPSAAAALVERWGALVSRPGVSLTRSIPVFLQPRFTKAVGGRFQASPAGAGARAVEGEAGLPLRRRVLALMDAYVAGQETAQWWRGWRASSTYVPFRACKTTQLLQSALGAPCKSLVLACVRPCTVAEVVLPASRRDRRGKATRELALSLFDRQAPVMLAEVYSTLAFADRVNTATHDTSTAKKGKAT